MMDQGHIHIMQRIFKRMRVNIVLLALLLMGGGGSTALALNCVQCHDSINFKGKYEHTPVQKNECDACHSLHVSRHPGLLLHEEAQLCSQCHMDESARWDKARYSHAPVRQGDCTACHDPHASAEPGLLKDAQKQVCSTCHASLAQTLGSQHAPFARGECARCHAVHGSNTPGLLRSAGAQLCLPCHKSNAGWQRKHMGYSAVSMDCLECHHPHSSTENSLLRELQHQPFDKGKCSTCHSGSSAAGKCLECHSDVLPQFQRVHTHLQGQGDSGCITCHSPHVSSQKGLLKGVAGSVCRDCHADKLERRESALHVHPQANRCSDCHVGHGSDEPYMLRHGLAKACDSCHGEHSTFTHPIGDNVLDPRTGTPMDCISCHAPCTGTAFEHNLRGGRERGLCIPCHPGY